MRRGGETQGDFVLRVLDENGDLLDEDDPRALCYSWQNCATDSFGEQAILVEGATRCERPNIVRIFVILTDRETDETLDRIIRSCLNENEDQELKEFYLNRNKGKMKNEFTDKSTTEQCPVCMDDLSDKVYKCKCCHRETCAECFKNWKNTPADYLLGDLTHAPIVYPRGERKITPCCGKPL
jgi:hypothetical protein